MHALLLILYCIPCAYGIINMRFIQKSRIRPGVLLLLFALHVITGCIHNLIAWRYYPDHGDIWMYFQFSLIESHRLVSDFPTFWYYNSHWDFFSHNAITFIHILLNPLSLNNLYINTLLFSFPVFMGNIALFRVFRHRFPDDPLSAFLVFLLPSVLFWTSCIHREAVIYMLIGFLLYHSHRLLTDGFTWKRALYNLLCLVLIAWFRSSIALLLLPALYCWLFAEKPRARAPLLILTAITAVCGMLMMPVLHLPGSLALTQHEFLSLEGHSRLWLPPLDDSWGGMFKAIPTALLNGFFEPLPGSGGQPIYWAFSLELLVIWAIVLLALWQKFRSGKKPAPETPDHLLSPFGLFCLLFAFGGMLLIGLLIPFAGAIVRYRSLYLLFLLAPFLHALRTVPPFKAANEWFSKHLFYRL